MLDVINLFHEKETRDELGIGTQLPHPKTKLS